MKLFNKKIDLVLVMFCFAFVSMNAQDASTTETPNPIGVSKNTFVADSAKSDNSEAIPEGDVSKNTFVADPSKMDMNEGVKKVAEKKEPVEKPVTKTEVVTIPEVDLAAPTVEEVQDGSVEKASTNPKVVDADGDGKIDNPESVKTSTAKVSKTNVMKDEDKDQDGVIDKQAAKKENN